jgi:hypothetical protein
MATVTTAMVWIATDSGGGPAAAVAVPTLGLTGKRSFDAFEDLSAVMN